MRASKKGRRLNPKPTTQNPKSADIHISGAEGLYEDSEISKILIEYTRRALNHPRGTPDKIVITIEKIRQEPMLIQSLPVTTLRCSSLSEADSAIRKILKNAGISETAVRTAFKVLRSNKTMRGASIVLAETGKRIEPDKERGIRSSMLGISKTADNVLSRKLAEQGINNTTVKEAIILASKVALCKNLAAELCISDDPDYTTGYISSRQYGYVRIPDIKKKGDQKGGRVFFVKENADIDSVIRFLEKTPVLINRTSECSGLYSIDEILDRCHR